MGRAVFLEEMLTIPQRRIIASTASAQRQSATVRSTRASMLFGEAISVTLEKQRTRDAADAAGLRSQRKAASESDPIFFGGR